MNQVTQHNVRVYYCRFPIIVATGGSQPQIVVIDGFLAYGFGVAEFGINCFQFIQCGGRAYVNPIIGFLYQSVGCFESELLAVFSL